MDTLNKAKASNLLFLAKSFFVFIALFSFAYNGSSQTVVTNATPGTYTWTVPSCVSQITVKVWGAGGGGGGTVAVMKTPSTDGEACSGSGGGGGGGYTTQTIAVTPGQQYIIVVGKGGTGGTAGNGSWNGGINPAAGDGIAGGTSSFTGNSSNLSATGGAGGKNASGFNSSSVQTDVNTIGAGGAGGAGAGGSTNYSGGAGGGGYIAGNFSNDFCGSGGGAAGPGGNGGSNLPPYNGPLVEPAGGVGQSPGGNGAKGRYNNQPGKQEKPGYNGNGYGGGGGGSVSHMSNLNAAKAAGGNGADGAVIIEYNTAGTVPATPTVNTVQPTCTLPGYSVITDYNSSYTYTFTPAGPTIDPATGLVENAVNGTSYTVVANNGSCNSQSSTSFTNAAMLPVPATPTIVATTQPTCSADGGASISNYNSNNTYTFAPSGPTVGAGGVISGMVPNTVYHVVASNGSCSSASSNDINVNPKLPTPPKPTISTTQPTCTLPGYSVITNYDSTYTYTFTPSGPTIETSTGLIENTINGTSYTVVANNGSCNSQASASFTNTAILPAPVTPTIVATTPPTCSADGGASIGNYDSNYTYTFTPSGPTVGAGGVISGMVPNTVYHVVANNGGCPSASSNDININPKLPSPPDPVVNTTQPTCTLPGYSVITNYDSTYTYTFTPSGPTIETSTGLIENAVDNTGYTVVANNGSCPSKNPASFNNSPMLPSPAAPIIATTPASCGVNGSASITNYNAAYTYTFTPSGPTVGVNGVVTGMVPGTVYHVEASLGSCKSSSSNDAVIDPMLPPTIPTVTTTSPTCSASGSSLVTNYSAGYNYTFNPPGPSVTTGGVIIGMIDNITYTVSADSAACTTPVSAPFSNSAPLPVPVVSVSDTIICFVNTITLSPDTSGSWVSNNPAVATVTSSGNVSIVSPGNVSFTFTASNTCQATTKSVTVNAMDKATFNYSTNTFCLTGLNPTATIIGTSGGTFTISSPGVINATTGEIDLTTSGLGVFIVTYNTNSSGNACPVKDSTTVTITTSPQADFIYDVTQVCKGGFNPVLILSNGSSAGVFTSAPSGLTLNPTNGSIILSSSAPGSYTVYNTIAASGGCAMAIDSTTIEIFPKDNASFNFSGNAYCISGSNPTATITGTTGGTFTISSPGVINSTTGEINLSTSGVGSFTVTYNTNSAGNACPTEDSTIITIIDAPKADFNYNVMQACQADANPILTLTSGSVAGIFTSSPSGLTLDSTNGNINLSNSAAGIYTVYNTIAASGGCLQVIDSATIQVHQQDNASFNFSGNTYCISGSNPTATITGTTGGTFTISSPGVINSTTGEINLSTSGVGSFTVTYNTNSSGNSCPVKDSTIITITNSPKADFSYDAIQSCQSAVNPILTLASGSVAGIFTSSPSGLTLDSTNGNINLSSSVAGSYTVYNTVVASGGCAGVKDSTIITVKASYQLNETVSICKGSSYTFPDGTMQANIISSTTHTSNLLSITGCDSVISTQVTIKFSYLIQESVNVCSGGNYTFADGSTVNNITTTIMHNSNLSTTLGCDSIIETTVLATPNNTISVNAIASLCNPSQITLTANGSGNGVVTWYSDRSGTTVLGTGSPLNIPATSSGTFTYYTNEAGSCASNIDSVSVTVSLVHAAITATPTEGMAPLEVAFGNQSSTGSNITYLWEFEEEHNSNLFEPSYTFNENGTYQVILTVSDGNCKDTAMVTVKAIGKSDLDIPNIFSPNGDGRNDVFSMIGKNLAEIKGEIYNRWGQKLYEWDSPHTSWDGRTLSGTEAPQGIYYYIIEAKGFDNVKYNKTGAVTLVR